MGSVEELMQSCRLCLVKEQVTVPIFDESSDVRKIFEKINLCLPVKVNEDDNLPKKICDGCSYKLDMVYLFRNTSVESEKQLVQWLKQAGISPVLPQVRKDETTSEIMVKQEIDAADVVSADLGTDAQSYIMQQQKLPYQDFPFGGEPAAATASNSNETDNGPAPKRPRRSVAAKKKEIIESEEEDEDDDFDNSMPVTKEEDDDSDEEDRTEFDAPSTSTDAQPGPSGIGTSDATFDAVDYLLLKPQIHLDETPGAAPALPPSKPPLRRPKKKKARKDQILACPTCALTFTGAAGLAGHACDPAAYCCRTCFARFPKLGAFNHHLTRHLNLVFVCPVCAKQFKTKVGRDAHCAELHVPAVRQKVFECAHCAKVFTRKGSYKTHLDRHSGALTKRFLCDLCGKCCWSGTELRVHRLTHTGEKEVVCNLCGKQLANKGNLDVHLLVHQNIKKFECEICADKFTTKSNLKSHHVRKHVVDRPTYPCSYCPSSFSNKTNLKYHMVIHTGVEPYACTFCDKKFFKKVYLVEHLRVHTKERPYECQDCKRRFTQRGPLRAHKCLYRQPKDSLMLPQM